MTTFLHYDLKVARLIAVFYMFYRLLAARETFHRLNRMVLLVSLALSLLLPLCVVTVHRTVEVASMPQPTTSVGMAEAGEIVEDEDSNSTGTILAVVYLLGVAFCLARTSINIWSVRRLIARCREVAVPSYIHGDIGGMRLFVADDAKVKPFSWMRTVVLSRKDYENDLADGARGQSIVLAHECGHVACRHSVDMLFVDMVVALQWFNPVVWLLRQDLRTVHEYEADARVLSQGFNAYQYLSLLVQKAAGDAGYSVANGISMSSIVSKRVIMMTKNQSSRYSWAKLLYIVPIVAISLAATAKTVVDYKVVEMPETAEAAATDDDKLYVVDDKVAVVSDTTTYRSIRLGSGKESLFVVDGNVMTKEDVLKIDPKTIESISVAKDKASVKKWGSKADNGVVFITTKGANSSENALATDSVLMIPEEMPSFPGGVMALMEFLQKNVKYPVEAQKKGVQGRVLVSFVVEKDGSLSEIKTVKSVDPLLDEEAVRVVKSMPKWEPGKQKGKAVRVKYNVPISFKLTGTNTDGQAAPAAGTGSAHETDILKAPLLETSEKGVFAQVEQMPHFAGGDKALMEFLAQNVRYPKEAVDSGWQGRVVVSFIVEKDGSLSEIKTVKSVKPVLDEEAVRVVNAMPKWTPGKHNGNAVRVKYNIPVSFRLQ